MSSKKKSKQKRSSGNPSNYSALYKGDASGVSKAAPPPVTEPVATTAAKTVNWQEEYGYVFRDLRTLLLVSLLLFAGILVIGFFL